LGIIFGAFDGAGAERKRHCCAGAGAGPRLTQRVHFALTGVPPSQGTGMAALVYGPLDF
jgi:hypothetical protein